MGANTSIRIAFVVGSVSRAGGGVAQSARLLAQAVRAQGAEVEVLTLRDAFYEEDVGAWRPLGVRAFAAFGTLRYGFSPSLLSALLRCDADIVHVHGVWTFQCLAVLLWALAKRRPYVVTPHGMLEAWIRRRSPLLKLMVSALYQDRFLRGAALLHLLTEKERDDVAGFAPLDRVLVLPNCVEPFEPPRDPPDWLGQGFVGRDVYLFLGRIHEKKGCLELCAAWDGLCADDLVFRDRSLLVFAGWIDDLPGFAERVNALQARHGNAVFIGPQYGEEKRRCLSTASFFVLPSKSEGLPVSVLEAWSAGKPVLMSAACNLPIGFEAGAASEIGTDAQGIRHGLLAACSMTQEERSQMGRAAESLVVQHYSGEAVAVAMMALYRETLAPCLAAHSGRVGRDRFPSAGKV